MNPCLSFVGRKQQAVSLIAGTSRLPFYTGRNSSSLLTTSILNVSDIKTDLAINGNRGGKIASLETERHSPPCLRGSMKPATSQSNLATISKCQAHEASGPPFHACEFPSRVGRNVFITAIFSIERTTSHPFGRMEAPDYPQLGLG